LKFTLFGIFLLIDNNKYINLITRLYQFEIGKKYLNKCFENGILDNIDININEIKITVIIPIFNCQDSIKFSISSIQNQRLKEIEIILVNDFSEDNSRYIIENMRKYDKRISIINNNKNRGTLYSRNIGAIFAKGKYIFALDHDDMFFNDYIIYKMYIIAEKKNYDIIGFKTIYSNKEKNFQMYDEIFITDKNEKFIIQPELKFLSITNKDAHIWGKCIKSEIYKKAISLMGKKRSNTYLCYAEDDVIVYMLFSTAKNFKFIPNFGILHFISSQTASFKLSENHKLFSKIFLLDLIFDFTENNFIEKSIAFEFIFAIKKFINSKKFKINNQNKKYLKKIFNKILNCSYISKENKTYLNTIIY